LHFYFTIVKHETAVELLCTYQEHRRRWKAFQVLSIWCGLRGRPPRGLEQVAPHPPERFDFLARIPGGRGYRAGVIFVDEVVEAVTDEIYGARGILGVVEDFFHVEAERDQL
jgi:hypothetical protein